MLVNLLDVSFIFCTICTLDLDRFVNALSPLLEAAERLKVLVNIKMFLTHGARNEADTTLRPYVSSQTCFTEKMTAQFEADRISW